MVAPDVSESFSEPEKRAFLLEIALQIGRQQLAAAQNADPTLAGC